MEIKIHFNGKPEIKLIYTEKEFKALSFVLEKQLNLIKTTTLCGFGINNNEMEYYQERSENLKKYITNSLEQYTQFFDSINKPIFQTSCFNFAIFRIIPIKIKGDYVVSLPLDKLLTIAEVKKLVEFMRTTLTFLFNLVLEEEITINIEKGGIKK